MCAESVATVDTRYDLGPRLGSTGETQICNNCNYTTKHNETIKINSWTNCICEVRIEILKQIDADKGNVKLNLPNYKWFGFNNKNQLKKARSGSGGVRIFLKCNILDEWNFSEIDRNIDGLYVVCLTHKTNDFKLVLNPCYLPPENSSWGMESDAYFNYLLSTLYSIEDMDLFIGGGDINARIGHNNDFIVDVDTHYLTEKF